MTDMEKTKSRLNSELDELRKRNAEFEAGETDRKKTEEALWESMDRQRLIIENTDAGYFFIDRDGLFQHVNDAWLQMHGYDSTDEVDCNN